MDTSNLLVDTMTSNKDVEAPALGKFWRSACSMRLLIAELSSPNVEISSTSSSSSSTNHNSNYNSNCMRSIRIVKCNRLKRETQCVVNITDTGVI